MLRTLVLAGDNQPGRDVPDAHRRLDLVDILPSLAAGAKRADLELGRRQFLLLALLDLCDDIDTGETGVAALVRVERRDTHKPVHAPLGLAKAVGILAGDQQRCALDAGDFAREQFADLDRPAALLTPALVHAQEHVGPVARLGAAGAGVDGEDAVAVVVRPVEHQLQLERLQPPGELGQVGRQLGLDVLLRGLVLAIGQFDHRPHVGVLRLGLEQRIDAALNRRRLGDEFLGIDAIVPEIVLRHLPLDFRQAVLCLGNVKDTS